MLRALLQLELIKLDNVYPNNGQAGWVYNEEGICPTLVTFTGGGGKQPIVKYKINNKNRSELMYNNILEKLNFKMDEIKLFDSFAGIGALHQALKELGVPVKLTGISEIDVDAIISYAAIHVDNFKDIPFEYPSDDEMKKYLIDRNIGYDFDKQKSLIPRMKKDKLKWCYKATILTNCMGDVSNLDFNKIPDSDLFNFSFPCTNVSNAGKQEGFTKEDGSVTHSGLYIYGIEAIKAKKFKYIMIENVKGLISKKFVGDFYKIVEEIESLGYNCYYPKKDNGNPTCLNAKDYGIPQNRERIFVICIRKDIDKNNFTFPIGKDYGIRLKHILEDTVEEKYYLSQEVQERFKFNGNKDIERNELNVVGSSAPDFRTIGQRDITYDMEQKGNGFRFEPHVKDNADIAKTVITRASSRMDDNYIIDLDGIEEKTFKFDSKNKYINKNELNQLGYVGNSNSQGNRVYDINGIAVTQASNSGGLGAKTGLYTDGIVPVPELVGGIGEINFGKQYRQGNRVYSSDKTAMCLMAQPVGNTGGYSYLYDVDYKVRKLTPKECWRLMGFRDEHIDRAKELGISDSSLYKQAGNSIVVNVLYFIFKNLFSEYII